MNEDNQKKQALATSLYKYFKIVVVILLVVVGYQTIYRAAWNSDKRTDLLVYRAAGEAVLHHTDIYKAQDARGWNYVYPPASAILIAPLAKLPVALMALVWFLLEVAAIGGAIWMSIKLLFPKALEAEIPWLAAIPSAMLITFLVSGVQRCQESEFMIWLIIACIYCSLNNKTIAAGLTLAAAVLIKVFPITLVGYFIIMRQWRAVLATLAGIVVLGILLPSLVFGWQKNINYIEEWAEIVAEPALHSNEERANSSPLYGQLLDAQKPRNQSLESLFLTLGFSPSKTRYLVIASGLLMFGVMLFAATKVTAPNGHLALASAFVIWHLLIPPISETHYFGVLILPVTLLAKHFLERTKAQLTFRWCLLVVAFLAINLPFALRELEILRPLCWFSLFIWGFMIKIAVQSPGQDQTSSSLLLLSK
jgi:hypothetical protein